MKRSTKIIIAGALAVVIAVVVIFVVLGNKKEKTIIGTWSAWSGMETMVFRDDGTASISGGFSSMHISGFTYDDHTIVVSYARDDENYVSRKVFYSYELSKDGKSLTSLGRVTRNYYEDGSEVTDWVNKDNNTCTFTRVD